LPCELELRVLVLLQPHLYHRVALRQPVFRSDIRALHSRIAWTTVTTNPRKPLALQPDPAFTAGTQLLQFLRYSFCAEHKVNSRRGSSNHIRSSKHLPRTETRSCTRVHGRANAREGNARIWSCKFRTASPPLLNCVGLMSSFSPAGEKSSVQYILWFVTS